MEILLQSQLIFSILFIFLHFPSLSVSQADSYTLPTQTQYFVNCGSDKTLSVFRGFKYAGDQNPGEFRLSGGESRAVENSTSSDVELYRTARIFRTKGSFYEFATVPDGIYVVRFRFYPFSALGNLSDARFNVFRSRFSFLRNFTVENSEFPLTVDFLHKATSNELRISFEPYGKNHFAFVNAIEVFLAREPNSRRVFIPDSAPRVTQEGNPDEYMDILNVPLRIIHRINVGGEKITPDYDTLLRSWVPDDDYLFNNSTAKKSPNGTPKYQEKKAWPSDAPPSVYSTAREMNIVSQNATNLFNVSWRFEVKKKTKHFVRVHFCDIVTRTSNEKLKFNLYIYSNFGPVVYPWDVYQQTAVPFYMDFVVDSDSSGLLNISVGPKRDEQVHMAFLNGVEIMELVEEKAPDINGPANNHLLVIVICSCVGGVLVVLLILAVIYFTLKKRKWKSIDVNDWQLTPFHGGSSYSRTTNGTVAGSPLADLNLGLRIPLSEILYATKRFNNKMMIGEGGFGKVYKGTLRDGRKVAVKRSEPGHGQGLPEFQTEVMVLSKIRHQHLVSMIGYCDERDEMILVYEFMEKGTLRGHLYLLKGESKESSVSRSQLSWDQRLTICIGAAKGLHYLHTGSTGAFIHRDVKSTNILLDENYVAKVADFGLSRSGLPEQTHVSTDVKGSFGYLDPEYLKCFQFTQKSDVYAFGVVLLEVLCARPVIDLALPREQVNLAEWGTSCMKRGELDKIMDPLLVGKINPNSLRKFGETVDKCLLECGSDRPNMVDVLWDLEYCLKLQQPVAAREGYEDSSSDVAWGLPMPVLQHLPSNSGCIREDDDDEVARGSCSFSSEVFSQLKIDGAR